MATRIRGFRWTETPLGPIEQWPTSLKVAVQLILALDWPSHICVGDAWTEIYNDGHAALIGSRHPDALGRDARATLDEAGLLGMLTRVFAGESLTQTFQPPPFARPGVDEPACCDLSGVPLRDETGAVFAVLVMHRETTARLPAPVLRSDRGARQAFLLKLSDTLRTEPDADAIVSRAVQLLYEALQLDRCYVVSFHLDEGQAHVSHAVGRAGLPTLPPILRLADYPDCLRLASDRTVVVEDAATAPGPDDGERHALAAIGLRAFIVPALRRGEHNPIWAVVAASARPRRWTPDEVALVEEVAERTWAAREHARAAAALRESEAKYRNLFESVDTGCCVIEIVCDGSGVPVEHVIREANPAFQRQTGLADAVGRTIRALVPGLEEFWFETYERIVRTGQPERFEHRADALDRWYSVYAFRIGRAEQGRVAVLFEDIKARKLRELHAAFCDQIGKELARLSSPDEIMQTVGARIGDLLRVSGCVFCDVDEDRDEVTVHHGWTADGVPSLKQTFRLRDYVTPAFARAHRAGEDFIVRDTARDGRTDGERYARLQIGAFVALPFLWNGRWMAYFAVNSIAPRDWRPDEIELLKEVSARLFSRLERARAEAALRASAERQAFLLKLSDASRPLADAGALRAVACRLLGEHLGASRAYYVEYLPKEGYGVVTDDYLVPGLPSLAGRYPFEAFRSTYERIASGATWVVPDVGAATEVAAPERDFYLSQGVVAWVDVPLVKSGNLEAALCTVQTAARRWTAHEIGIIEDTAERLWSAIQRGRAETARRESEARFAQFADASSDALWIRDAATLAMEYVSPAIARLYGVEPGAFLGDVKRWAATIVPEDRDLALAHIERARRGAPGVHEFRIQRTADQTFRWIRNTCFPLRDERGSVERIGGIFEDVTETKLSIEHQAVLLSELQHRVRNIMAIVRSVAARSGERAESIAEYAALLEGRLLALARVQVLLTRAANAGVGIAALVRDEVSVQAHHKGQYDLAGPDLQLSPKAAEVLTLAVHELATNAVKYGALSVATGRVVVRWTEIERRGAPWLALDWTEEGAPRPPEPGPATPRRRGFGSELIEDRIPYELKGHGRVELGPAGARCRIEFPLRDGASILETGAPQRATAFGGVLDMTGKADLCGHCILVVEDDYYLASDTTRALRGAGAAVLGPVPTEAAALAALETGAPTGAVVDINLGAGASFTLPETLKRRGVAFVFVTGYDEQMIPPDFATTPRLQKPVDLRQIVRTLAEVLPSSRLPNR